MPRCASDDCSRWRPDWLRHLAGVTVDSRWFCSQACVEQMARGLFEPRPRPSGLRSMPPLRLGVLLRHGGLITADQLHAALKRQRETHLKLGAQLRELGYVEDETIMRTLAAQAGTRYIATIDPSCVREAPGGLSPHAVRALGLIPFSEVDEDRHIKVACVAPVPRAALTALHRLTGWTADPFLVSDEHFASLLEVYGVDAPRRVSPQPVADFIAAHSLSEAAQRIAAFASTARQTTVIEAHWAPYTLVRVQGPGVLQDVLLAHAGGEEAACLAANTSR